MQVSQVIFREDLYPRIATSHETVQKYAQGKKASPFTFFEVLRRQVAAVYPQVGKCGHLTNLFACAEFRREQGWAYDRAPQKHRMKEG
jgi:hypothetical protein